MTFANRIKELRQILGLSQRAFGEKIGRQQQTIAQWENGRNTPDPQTIAVICITYNVSADYLLGLTDDPAPRDDVADRTLAEELAASPDAVHVEMTEEELAAKLPEDIRDTVLTLVRVAIEKDKLRNNQGKNNKDYER